jgi:hypothetical protein
MTMLDPAEGLVLGSITFITGMIALNLKNNNKISPSPNGQVGKVFWYGFTGYGLTLIGWSLLIFFQV